MTFREDRTKTSAFGVGRREGHDSSDFYARFSAPIVSDDATVNRPPALIKKLGAGTLFKGTAANMKQLPDNSIALVVTSPPYFVGKEYELAFANGQSNNNEVPKTYIEFLSMLHEVFTECYRVLEPGGRMAINVANLGRKPYRSLSSDIVTILQDELSMLLRGEIIWEKASASSGSCAWGSFGKATNPVLRDMTERVIIASKGRFNRALSARERKNAGLPFRSTIANDEFVDVTRDVWRIEPESATRIGHPAPFPVDLPRRLIDLYTFEDDIVLDPFAGSGTTLVAAARTGRIGVGYDLDASYIDLAKKRLAGEQRKKKPVAKLVAKNDRTKVAASVATLSFDDRHEYFLQLAVQDAKKIHDLTLGLLEESGFANITDKTKKLHPLVEFAFSATGSGTKAQKTPWLFDIGGVFTTSRPGLQRPDTLWKTIGRLSVAHSASRNANNELPRVVLITPSLPKPDSPGFKALSALGSRTLFDAIELYDPAGRERLARYAAQPTPTPLPGFWSESEIARASH